MSIIPPIFSQNFNAVYWSSSNPASILDLNALASHYNHSEALSLNNANIVVGYSYTNNTNYFQHAFRWDSVNGLQDLNNIVTSKPANFLLDWAASINNLNQIVGTGVYTAGPNQNIEHAFLDTNGGVTDLGAWRPYRINDSGQITGTNGHALLYNSGSLTDLGTLYPDPMHPGMYLGSSTGFGLNKVTQSHGVQVVGSSTTSDNSTHAFIYSGGVMTDLSGSSATPT